MKKNLLFAIAACTVLVGAQAHALNITPTTGTLGTNRWQGPIITVPPLTSQNSDTAISTYIASIMGNDPDGLYKANVDTGEEWSLSGSYATTFTNTGNDPSDAQITYTGGTGSYFVGPNSYLLVKDGNHTPYWYLYWLASGDDSLGWNGTEMLELSGFWPAGGAISHVALYGTSTYDDGGGGGGNPIPEPGTMLLLGTGLVGLAGVGRRSRKG